MARDESIIDRIVERQNKEMVQDNEYAISGAGDFELDQEEREYKAQVEKEEQELKDEENIVGQEEILRRFTELDEEDGGFSDLWENESLQQTLLWQ